MAERIYLDHNATTPLAPEARRAMEAAWESGGANPSSVHAEGRRARGILDEARDRLAEALKVKSAEIIFTAGGTESNNLAVLGLARAHADKGRHIITSQGEHHAVLHACQMLEKFEGFRVTYLPLDGMGRIDPEQLAAQFTPETILVSILSANNETGVRSPMPEIGRLCAERGVLFHTDAVQSAGKEPLEMAGWQTAALSLTAHKFYGPVGAGALVLRTGVPIRSISFGGAHENERRPGTENVPALAGLAAVVPFLAADISEAERQFHWVEKLWQRLASLKGVRRNGDPRNRLPNTLNVSFAGLDGEELLMGLDLAGLAVSSGSACMVGSVQTSHVLQAMGVAAETARATVRFSAGKTTRDQDLEEVAARVIRVVAHQHKVHQKR